MSLKILVALGEISLKRGVYRGLLTSSWAQRASRHPHVNRDLSVELLRPPLAMGEPSETSTQPSQPSDLWDAFDQMERAEPLDPEEDLVLRMSASGMSRVRHVVGVGANRERKKKEQGGGLGSASRGIAKRRGVQRANRAADGMHIDSVGKRPSAVAAQAAKAVAGGADDGMKLRRSASFP